MHPKSLLKLLALIATDVALTCASPMEHREVGTYSNFTSEPVTPGSTLVTISKCANLFSGQSAEDPSVVWEDCPAVVARHEALQADYDAMTKRGIVCKKRNGCQPPCYAQNTDQLAMVGRGTWWTRWCHQGGLHTHSKGSQAWVSVGHSTSVEWSGSVSLAGKVGDFVNAQLGFKITKTKSINQGVGCVNADGKAHAVWLRERMGWTETTVTSTTTYVGAGCSQHGTFTTSRNVHADFPDPNNSGYRDLLAGCGSPDNDEGPWCNLNAASLNKD